MQTYFDFRKLINWSYLKETPRTTFKFTWLILIICLVSFVIGIFLRLIVKPPKPQHQIDFSRFISIWLIYPAIFGALLVFFRIEGIPTLSSRLLMLVLFLVWIYGLFWILVYGLGRFRRQTRDYQIAQRKAKYLPKPKK